MPPTRATAVNARILRWARERAGLDLGEVAARLQKTPEIIAAWESGEAFPTYNQLELLAESVFHRPVAMFFLPNPPEEEPIEREFRVLPHTEVDQLSADTRYALRDARAFQRSLMELTGGRNPAERVITKDFSPAREADPLSLARRVRAYLGVDSESSKGWDTPREAMTWWRDRVESVGVFVFKRSFDQREVSGFCVFDQEFPIIVVNNSTAFTRQIFTLVHELGHLLFGVSSITSDEAFDQRLTGPTRELEIACNRFAAELLVPEESFPWADFHPSSLDEFAQVNARRYGVSKEVILRKLLDRQLIDQATYASRVQQWRNEGDSRAEGRGGNYYATQAAYLGKAFLSLAFSQYRAGNIGLPELADHLKVRARNLGKLEDFAFQQG